MVLDDIQTLLDAMRDRRGELAAFEDALGEISSFLSDILVALNRDKPSVDQTALVEAIRAIPAPVVNVAAPSVNPVINVQPAPVVVQPAPKAAQRTLTGFRIVERDGNGAIANVVFNWSE